MTNIVITVVFLALAIWLAETEGDAISAAFLNAALTIEQSHR